MSNLLNRAATKKFILAKIQALRPGMKLTRVSKESLDKYEAQLRNQIEYDIMKHPTIGSTYKP